MIFKYDELVKSSQAVIPAQTEIHNMLKSLDSRLRGNDKKTKIDFLRDHQIWLNVIFFFTNKFPLGNSTG